MLAEKAPVDLIGYGKQSAKELARFNNEARAILSQDGKKDGEELRRQQGAFLGLIL